MGNALGNAQGYINSNFPKHVSEIIANGKDLDGRLDLSEYPNLNKVDVGGNTQLSNLSLACSNQITFLSIYDTSISDFSFLANLPNIQTICLPRGGDIIGGGSGSAYIAQVIREISKEKINQLNRLQSQLNQEQANNQNLQQQITQFTSQLQQKDQELEKLSQQFQQLSDLLFLNQPYNFTELKAETIKLKTQELAPQVRRKGTELEQLITNIKTKVGNSFEQIVDLLLETRQQIDQTNNTSQKEKLIGKMEAYQSILEVSLTHEEIKTLLNKQTELLQLEKQLTSLQVN